jgi:hypothetical protein
MKTTHKDMKISESDWSIFLEHAGATMKVLQVPQQECDDVAAFIKRQRLSTIPTKQNLTRFCISLFGKSVQDFPWNRSLSGEDGTFGSYGVTTHYLRCGLITLARCGRTVTRTSTS